jgi:hypothetical protein
MDNMKNELYEHLKTNKGVGHTRLMLDGAKNANYPFFIIGANIRQAKQLAADTGNNFAIPMTLGSNHLRGHDHPVLIDGHAFTTTCEKYISEIRDQREAINKAKKEVVKMEMIIHNIGRLPLYVRLFKPIYKRAIRVIHDRII